MYNILSENYKVIEGVLLEDKPIHWYVELKNENRRGNVFWFSYILLLSQGKNMVLTIYCEYKIQRQDIGVVEEAMKIATIKSQCNDAMDEAITFLQNQTDKKPATSPPYLTDDKVLELL